MSSRTAAATENSLVVWFDQLCDFTVAIAGGKGASLSRMVAAGLPVPPGFIVSSTGFTTFLESCNGVDLVRRAVSELDVTDQAALHQTSEQLRNIVLSAPLPSEIRDAICAAYRDLGEGQLVAVRSSAIGEDGEAASFAGQQETFLNVCGADSVAHHVQRCWASLFSPRALFYRAQKGALGDIRMAVVVQKMANAQKSGVMFTADPVQRRRDHFVIEAVLGLGEILVSGEITPDHYVIDRHDASLVREFIPGSRILTNSELHRLWEMGLRLEAFFGKPQDVEWCIDGGELLLLQSRPITTL
jgi:pyruvate, water dikinase